MKIVIDIPNWLYNAILEHKEPVYSRSLGDAVRDGTPLPKGHGKLIDSNILWNAFQDLGQDFYEAFDFAEDNAVIEADTENEG